MKLTRAIGVMTASICSHQTCMTINVPTTGGGVVLIEGGEICRFIYVNTNITCLGYSSTFQSKYK